MVYDLLRGKNFTPTRLSTGGVTGSLQVRDENAVLYQLKPSILDNTFLRRRKADELERENFGEVIAAAIARAFLPQGLVPEVFLVYADNGEGKKRVYIASKYLSSQGTLDAFSIGKTQNLPEKSRHMSFRGGQSYGLGWIGLDHGVMAPLKSSLAQAVVVSAFVGDHDINPGNMLVTQEPESAARIDFGHAFNDLIMVPENFGGGILYPENPCLDFFNREHVAGFPRPEPSKLWRDYPGLVGCPELVEALRELGSKGLESDCIKQGLDFARDEFRTLIQAMRAAEDEEGLKHIKDSLMGIYENLEQSNIPRSLNSKAVEEVLEETLKACEGFVQARCEDALKLAKVMELQLKIDEALKKGQEPKELDFSGLPCDQEGQIFWVKMQKNTPAFVGSLQAYIEQRKIELKEEAKKVQEELARVREKNRKLQEEIENLRQKEVKVQEETLPAKVREIELSQKNYQLARDDFVNALIECLNERPELQEVCAKAFNFMAIAETFLRKYPTAENQQLLTTLYTAYTEAFKTKDPRERLIELAKAETLLKNLVAEPSLELDNLKTAATSLSSSLMVLSLIALAIPVAGLGLAALGLASAGLLSLAVAVFLPEDNATKMQKFKLQQQVLKAELLNLAQDPQGVLVQDSQNALAEEVVGIKI